MQHPCGTALLYHIVVRVPELEKQFEKNNTLLDSLILGQEKCEKVKVG